MSKYKYSTFEDELNRKKIKGGVLRTLEFDKIIAALTEKASTVYGRELCAGLCPVADYDTVASRLKETEEVYTYVNKYGPLPLNGFPDIRGSLSYGKAGGTMTMRQLLDAAVFLRSCEYIKGIVSNEKADMADTALFGTIKAIVSVPKLEKDISMSIDNEDEMNDRASDTLYRIRVEKKDPRGYTPGKYHHHQGRQVLCACKSGIQEQDQRYRSRYFINGPDRLYRADGRR